MPTIVIDIPWLTANSQHFGDRVPIIDKFKDMGTIVMGKIESGTVYEGNSLLVMPNKVSYPSMCCHHF